MLPRTFAAALLLTSYAVAWASVGSAVAFQTIILLPFFSWDDRDNKNVWSRFRQGFSIPTSSATSQGDDVPLFGGWDLLMLVGTWLPPATAMVATLLPVLLLPKQTRDMAWSTTLMQRLRAVGRKARRWLSYPMYPQRLWLWWCGGLSLLDALVLTALISAHGIAIWQITRFSELRYEGWDAIGMAYPQPRHVLRLRFLSRACAWTMYLDFTFIFFPVAHLSFLHTLLGSSWAAVIKYHRWLGHCGLWTLTGHAMFHYAFWVADANLVFWDQALDWNTKCSVNYLAGSVSWLAGLVLWVAALSWVRRRAFWVFQTTHAVCGAVFLAFAFMHYFWSWLFLIPGLVTWGLDVVLRTFQAQHVSAISSVRLLANGRLALIDIPMDASMAEQVRAGQEVFLQFPEVNRWSWHPFTIFKVNASTSPDTVPSITVAIRQRSRWTKALLTKMQQDSVSLPVKVVGPVGGAHAISHTAGRVVLFVGGAGASPALATLHQLMRRDAPPPTTVVFAARDPEELTMLDQQVLADATRTERPWLSLRLFCTRPTRLSAPAHKLEAAEAVTFTDLVAAAKSSASGELQRPRAMSASSSSVYSYGGYSTDAGSSSRAPSFAIPLTRLGDGVSEPTAAIEAHKAFVAAPETVQLPCPQPSTWLSSFAWRAIRPMQPRLVNGWHLLLAICVAWVGGFLGAVQAQSGLLQHWDRSWTIRDTWELGLLFLGCCLLQSVGLTSALVVLPVHVFRYLRASKATMLAATSASAFVERVGVDKLGSLELGECLHITPGRPDIPALLTEAVEGATGEEVTVIVAGPPAMVHHVELAAWEANWRRAPGAPFLLVIRQTFDL